MTNFATEFLFKRLPDFWDGFADREEVKCIWDAYVRKTNALGSLLLQAELSKSLATIPLFDKNELEYFVFPTLVRRTDLESNDPFYVFEVDPTIFYVKSLNEKIDNTLANRVLSTPDFFKVVDGTGDDKGKVFLSFTRGVAPVQVGETFWTNGSDVVTGNGFIAKVDIGDIIQGQNKKFFKVIDVTSDTQLQIQGKTVLGENLGPGNGTQVAFQLAATSLVIPSSIEIFLDGQSVPPANFTVTTGGLVTFTMAPLATISAITANYYLGYDGPTSPARRTVVEAIPTRLFSTSVYRDRRSVFNNFGVAIGLDRPTSVTYLNQVRGLYFARFNGPTLANMQLGSAILTDIPFSPPGRVAAVSNSSPKSVIVDTTLYKVAQPLDIQVTVGQQLTRDFNLLTDGIEIADYLSRPDIFASDPLKSDPAKYFTFVILVKGAYALYVSTTTGQPIDYTLLRQFAKDIKPSYTKFYIATDADFFNENMQFFVGPVDVTNGYDAAWTLEQNGLNFAVIPQYLTVNGYADEAALLGSGLVNMDNDSFLMVEELSIVDTSGTFTLTPIDTLENNLVNSGTFGGPPPDAMDDDSFAMVDSMQINQADGTPPGSHNPPFTSGTLLYATP